MAVIRVHKNKNYTVMSNYHLKHKQLSLKAKGLMSMMLSLPDEWDYSVNGLVAICKEKKTAVITGLTELKRYGYLVIEKKNPSQTESGRFEYEYHIYERPQKLDIEKPDAEKQDIENLGLENQPQLNTKQSNTDKSNTKRLNTKKIDYQLIADMYNDTCVSFPHVVTISDSRKTAIKARLKTYSVDDFKRLFEKAEASDFLKGANERNWSASFDWLIKDSNMAKVLEGNYDNKAQKKHAAKKNGFNNFTSSRNYNMRELESRLLNANKETPKTAGNDEDIRARAEALREQLNN